jgi:uncharacterized membrane protein YqjE
MNKNVGSKDRIVRTVLAIGLAVLAYVGVFGGTAQIVVGVIAAYLLITALLGTCLFYKLAGVDTCVEAQEYSTTDNRSGL